LKAQNIDKNISHKTIITIILASTFLFTFNQFLLITAYPTIMQEYSVNATQVQWLTNAFLLTTILFIPLTGYLSTTFSSRILVIISLCFLVLGTIVGLIAPNFFVLVLSRIVQAIGAGIMVPLVQTILLNVFPIKKRGFAMGLLGAVVNVAPASAPSISGMMIDYFHWKSLFWVMLPLSVTVLVLALLFMKNVTEQQSSQFDVISIILSGVGFTSVIFGLSNVSVVGYAHWSVLSTTLLGMILLVLFVKRQLAITFPVLNVRIFQRKIFLITTILIFINSMLLLSTETILPMFSQEVLGTNAFLSGFVLVPGTILLSITTLVAGKLFDRYGGKYISAIGFAFILLSTILFNTIGMEHSAYFIMGYFCFFMVGIGMTMMPLVSLGANSLDTTDIPHGSAIVNTVRQFAMAFGVIILTTIISVTINQLHQPYEAGAHIGIKLSFIVMSVLALIGICLSFLLEDKK
jgi:EmrB/QacA subfamily drug resistance transporter